MIITIIIMAIIFLIASGFWLSMGLKRRSIKLLQGLNFLWWIGAIGSALMTYLTWQARNYSENWAALGFIYAVLPYAVIVSGMLLIEIIMMIKLDIVKRQALILSNVLLIVFLLAISIFGLSSI